MCSILHDNDVSPTGYPKKTDGTIDYTPERRAPKTLFQVFKQTRLFLFTMALLGQNKQVPTASGEVVAWLTLLPVFVYLESLLSAMAHPGMTLKGFIMYRDESFRMLREIVNAVGNVRTLDSALLEVSQLSGAILRQHQVILAFKTNNAADADGLLSGNDLSGDNSTDSTMFSGHQTKTLQAKVAELEDEVLKKNGIVNRVVEEKRELQQKLTAATRRLSEYEGGGSARKRSHETPDDSRHSRRDRSPSRERSRGRSNSRSRKGVGFKRK